MLGLSGLKLIAIGVGAAALIGVPAWVGWSMGADSVRIEERDRADAEIAKAAAGIQERMDEQAKLTSHYKDLADEKYESLLLGLQNIRVVHTTVNNTIVEERKNNPEFYELQLPAGGIKAWEESRRLLQ